MTPSRKFKLVSDFKAQGDQPKAIKQLTAGIKAGLSWQTLLGVTGSGKTYTMAKVIEAAQRPTLVISHNKTLAAQLCSEFRAFFPENAVEYFVSYYDYYQPEAYIPSTDTYIAKDASINEEIDRLRHSATRSLIQRRDVIVVASVSCIYGLGLPEDYLQATIPLRRGQVLPRQQLLKKLVAVKYERNDTELAHSRFRVKGEVVDVFPSYEERLLRVRFSGDKIEKLQIVHPVTGKVERELEEVKVFPGTHYVTFEDRLETSLKAIEEELKERLAELKKQGKLVEAQRLETRTNYDLEMIREIGYCSGVENYSRHLSGRAPGQPPGVLLDYFPKDFLLFIDESHVTIPQIGGMYAGDRSRKETLVEHGFRLPSALDNRPLKFKEFLGHLNQAVCLGATPAEYELARSREAVKKLKDNLPASYPRSGVVEQLIRPTGLVDPEVVIRSTKGQVDDLIAAVRERVKKKQRVLVTTLTKRMAEELADYLGEIGLKVRYLHSDIDTLSRVDILRDLRRGEFDVLVGINLLREGLDLPEVALVAILDADKEGFLRSRTSLIQTMGRAARHVQGQVILYADQITGSIRQAVAETSRRRKAQLSYNKKHGITPKSIVKEIRDLRRDVGAGKKKEEEEVLLGVPSVREILCLSPSRLPSLLADLQEQMEEAANVLDFERAARLRDIIKAVEKAARRGKFRRPKPL